MTRSCNLPEEAREWIEIVENDTFKCCEEQHLLVEHVKHQRSGKRPGDQRKEYRLRVNRVTSGQFNTYAEGNSPSRRRRRPGKGY